MFEPYLKSFFVHSSDPTNIKLLKVSPSQAPPPSHSSPSLFFQLDIIANVAGETSIHTILREFRVSQRQAGSRLV